MFIGGWLHFRDRGSTSDVILDNEKVQQDTAEAVDTGKEVLAKAEQGLNDLGDEADDAIPDCSESEDPSPEKPTGQPVDSR